MRVGESDSASGHPGVTGVSERPAVTAQGGALPKVSGAKTHLGQRADSRSKLEANLTDEADVAPYSIAPTIHMGDFEELASPV